MWMFLFSIFSYVWVIIIWKTQNTVSGYKKRSKIQSHQIFWSPIPELWVVSFSNFASWPFYRRKSWETQNTVFGYLNVSFQHLLLPLAKFKQSPPGYHTDRSKKLKTAPALIFAGGLNICNFKKKSFFTDTAYLLAGRLPFLAVFPVALPSPAPDIKSCKTL